MRFIALIPAALALLLAVVPGAPAQCRRVQRVAVVEPVVVTAPVVSVTSTSFLAVPQVGYPVLGATYGCAPDPNIKRLADSLERIESKLFAPLPPAPVPAPTPPVPVKPPTAAMPRVDEAAGQWQGGAQLLATVKTSCARCHGASNPKAKLSLVTAAGQLAPLSQLDRLRAFAAVADGSMPSGGQPVSDDTLALFREWSKLK